MKTFSRRELLYQSLFGYGAIGLKSMMLGLPAAFLSRRIIAEQDKETFLIYSFDVQGGPINANCPGSYLKNSNKINHPDQFKIPVPYKLGTVDVEAASPWAELDITIKDRMHFIHYQSLANAHTQASEILMSSSAIKGLENIGYEMLPSAISQMLNLNTVSNVPILLNNRWGLTYKGATINSQSPEIISLNFKKLTEDKQKLLNFRDKSLNALYKDLCKDGTENQKNFCDQFITSRDEARLISEKLGELISQIEINDETNETNLSFAAALIAANATRVVGILIPFGGDNHFDKDLVDETDGLISGTSDISFLSKQMKDFGIFEKTTVALQGVFGRTLGIKGANLGRDHHLRSAVTVMFGPNVKPGVSGGIRETQGKEGGVATNINSQTGESTNAGDIKVDDSLASTCKTLVRACGVSEEVINSRISRGKVIKSAVY